jgi:D-amino-acid dehydrogenase
MRRKRCARVSAWGCPRLADIQPAGRRIVIIGGGAVGVTAGLWLQRAGCDVTLLDPNGGVGEGASFGNAGCLNSSSIVPMSMPGNLAKVPGWLLDPLGPLTIRWPYTPKIAPWIIKFLAAGRLPRVREQATALKALLAETVELYLDLAKPAGAERLIKRNGHLIVYRTQADFDADATAWRLRREQGIPFESLSPEELYQMEPSLSRDIKVGIFFPQNGYTSNPNALIRALGEDFVRNGGAIRRAKAREFVFEAERLRGVRADDGVIVADGVLVAAGAHSLPFARACGDDVMLDTERGYHIMIRDPEAVPSRSIMDATSKFVATPMDLGLRLAGTVEFAGLEAAPDWRRAKILAKLGRALFPALLADYPEERLTMWMGFRPSLPDSLPVIGHSRRSRDVVYAFGHGHVGLAAGARTGLLAADLLTGRPPHIDITPFSPRRF